MAVEYTTQSGLQYEVDQVVLDPVVLIFKLHELRKMPYTIMAAV